jgi:cytochrome c peroxidase
MQSVGVKTFISLSLITIISGLFEARAELPPVPVPIENPITEAKRVLGKILFWEEQLSSDNTVACGTCHIPASGGADPRQSSHPGPDLTFGTADDVIGSPGVVQLDDNIQPLENPQFGFSRQVTARAAPGITMSMYDDDLFWDGRAESAFINPQDGNEVVIAQGGALESQAVGPILSSVEMAHAGRSWEDVISKLETVTPLELARNIPADMVTALEISPDYPDLFSLAFGDAEITPVRIGMAIASYERTLVPDQTPWDLYMAGDETAMTESQIAGWTSFSEQTICDNCHIPPEFTDHAYHNIGLRPAADDNGRQAVTNDADDFGRFKTPSLRNAGLKKSLMHVGWITGIQDSIDFYNANADADNGIVNPHTQFLDNQTGIPTANTNQFVDYDTLSMFSNANNPQRGKDMQATVADFIGNGLTDPRVAAEMFPFDRPTLGSEMTPVFVPVTAFSGSWYDIKHDGEGWLIEITSNNQGVITWYTYDGEGNQVWLLGVGVIQDNSIDIADMLITSGGVFGPLFDPDAVVLEPWGSLLVEFIDCNSANFTYRSSAGTGVLHATRLTALSGLGCSQ